LTQIYTSEDPRFTLYTLGIRQILTHPVIGYGSSFLIVKIDNEFFKCDIHSNILSAFLTTGIFGGLLYLIIILRGFYDSIIVLRYYQDYSWLAIIFVFSFVANIFAYGFMEIWAWLPLIAIRASIKTQSREQNTNKDSEIVRKVPNLETIITEK
jgi:O-antigen ligase